MFYSDLLYINPQCGAAKCRTFRPTKVTSFSPNAITQIKSVAVKSPSLGIISLDTTI